MIISKTNDGKRIYTSWRENGEKKWKIVPFRPNFYVPVDENVATYKPSKYLEREFDYEQGEYLNLNGEPLKNV